MKSQNDVTPALPKTIIFICYCVKSEEGDLRNRSHLQMVPKDSQGFVSYDLAWMLNVRGRRRLWFIFLFYLSLLQA